MSFVSISCFFFKMIKETIEMYLFMLESSHYSCIKNTLLCNDFVSILSPWVRAISTAPSFFLDKLFSRDCSRWLFGRDRPKIHHQTRVQLQFALSVRLGKIISRNIFSCSNLLFTPHINILLLGGGALA